MSPFSAVQNYHTLTRRLLKNLPTYTFAHAAAQVYLRLTPDGPDAILSEKGIESGFIITPNVFTAAKTLLRFPQLFIVSNRNQIVYFANKNARHFAFIRFLELKLPEETFSPQLNLTVAA